MELAQIAQLVVSALFGGAAGAVLTNMVMPWWRRPRLRLLPFQPRPPYLRRAEEIDGSGNSQPAFYVNLAVANVGRGVAMGCEPFVTAVEDVEASRENWLSLRLLWAFENAEDNGPGFNLVPERDAGKTARSPRYFFNLCRISARDPHRLALVTRHSPTSQPTAFGAGRYRFRVTVYSQNTPPVDRWYTVEWDGTLSEAGLKVSEHVRDPGPLLLTAGV